MPNEATLSAIIADTTTKAFVSSYPNLLIVLAVIGIVAIIEWVFRFGRWFERRKK